MVRLGVPAQPATGILAEQTKQRRFAESLVADDVHFPNLGGVTLCDGECQVDPVALYRRHGGDDFDTIQTAVDVLTFEFLLRTVGQCLVERPPFSQSDFAQHFLQRLLVEFLGARKVDIGDGRAFFDDHHDHVAVHLKADVLEQA